MSYKVGVKTHKNSKDWAYNALRFSERGSAIAYGATLRLRWHDVIDFEVHESPERANCFYPVPSDRYEVVRGAPGPHNIELDDLAERGFSKDERKKK